MSDEGLQREFLRHIGFIECLLKLTLYRQELLLQ